MGMSNSLLLPLIRPFLCESLRKRLTIINDGRIF